MAGQFGLKRRMNSYMKELRNKVNAAGADLHAYVFGKAFSIVTTVGHELIKIYWLVVFQVFTFIAVPYFMIYGLILETHKLGSFVFSFAIVCGVLIALLTIAFFFANDAVHEDEKGSQRIRPAGHESTNLPAKNGKKRGLFLTLLRSIRRIKESLAEIFSPQADKSTTIGFMVRSSMILLFAALVIFNNFESLALSGTDVVFALLNNPLLAFPVMMFQYFVIEPITISISFFLTMW